MGAAVDVAVEGAEFGFCRTVYRGGVVLVVSEIFLAEPHQLVELHVARHGDDHARGGVVAAHEVANAFGGEALHVAFGTQNIVSQGVPLVCQFLVLVVDEFRGSVIVGIDFLEDHILLACNLVQWESAVEQDIGEKLETTFQMLGERGGVDAGLFLRGEGVELATHAVDAVLDVVGAAVFGAFEEGVLDEMGHPFVVTAFVAAAHIDIHAGVGDPRRCVAQDDFDSVVESVIFVHAVYFFSVGISPSFADPALNAMHQVQKRRSARVPRVISVAKERRMTRVQAKSRGLCRRRAGLARRNASAMTMSPMRPKAMSQRRYWLWI